MLDFSWRWSVPSSDGTSRASLEPWWRRTPRFGAVVTATLLAKVSHLVLEASLGPSPGLDRLGVATSLVLVGVAAWALVRLTLDPKRRFLWRVRRKLLLSYVLIGVVPVLLLVAFFLLSSFLMVFHVSAYLFQKGIDDVVDEVAVLAEAAAGELWRTDMTGAQAILERRRAGSRDRYPAVSLALVRAEPEGPAHAQTGPWSHTAAPVALPPWQQGRGFKGLTVFPGRSDAGPAVLIVRAVARAPADDRSWAVVVDLPLDQRVQSQLRAATGLDLETVTVVRPGSASTSRGEATSVLQWTSVSSPWSFNTVTLFDYVDWTSGGTGTLLFSLRVGLGEMFARLTSVQSRLGTLSLGDVFMAALTVLAVTFVVIEAMALGMGLALARSITGSVHALFEGTRKVKAGDFGHRIRVPARDQLGELADSFNEMTASIHDLMRQSEEKRRLEEELRIARNIQLSLLPREPIEAPGMTVSTVCQPALEVGGDYYDVFRLGSHRIGVLVADVAGKGTSAALYMAELKGLLLSLSRIHESPKALLVEVNRILSHSLDGRSFISMTYAVMDMAARTLIYARAGHTSLIHATRVSQGREAHAHAPAGMVVGLQVEGAAQKFEALLCEETIHLQADDLIVLFTDGISEAMNPESDLFGESRLLAIVADDRHGGADALRDRILGDLRDFMGRADQHDDMTMIVIQIDGPGEDPRLAPSGVGDEGTPS